VAGGTVRENKYGVKRESRFYETRSGSRDFMFILLSRKRSNSLELDEEVLGIEGYHC